MNFILTAQSKKMPVHTLLGPLVESFELRHEKYIWLLTDFEATFGRFADRPRARFRPEVITGTELTQLAKEFPTGQIVWGVLSALPTSQQVQANDLPVTPKAKEGTSFWDPKPRLQYPNAAIEIIAWDRLFTILVSTDPVLSKAFKTHFPEAAGLEEYNRNNILKKKTS